MTRFARSAGARFEERDGWTVATTYGDRGAAARACAETVGFIDMSHLGKLEIQGSTGDLAHLVAACEGVMGYELGHATRAAGAWWCRVTAERMLSICEPFALKPLRERLDAAVEGCRAPVSIIDVTAAFAALRLVGPRARETVARFCAIDLRPQAAPVQAVRPGSVARTPGLVLREATDCYLMLFGSAHAEYMWTVVSDAASGLDGTPLGVDDA